MLIHDDDYYMHDDDYAHDDDDHDDNDNDDKDRSIERHKASCLSLVSPSKTF